MTLSLKSSFPPPKSLPRQKAKIQRFLNKIKTTISKITVLVTPLIHSKLPPTPSQTRSLKKTRDELIFTCRSFDVELHDFRTRHSFTHTQAKIWPKIIHDLKSSLSIISISIDSLEPIDDHISEELAEMIDEIKITHQLIAQSKRILKFF